MHGGAAVCLGRLRTGEGAELVFVRVAGEGGESVVVEAEFLETCQSSSSASLLRWASLS